MQQMNDVYPAIEKSPLQTFLDGCAEGRLLYQVSEDGSPVFFPRLLSPGDGGRVEWRESSGLGAVHAATTVTLKGQEPYNVVLVDMDDGFRLMSTVREHSDSDIPIGLRVRVRMEEIDGESRPVFVATS